jgi:chondroitin AC lyase
MNKLTALLFFIISAFSIQSYAQQSPPIINPLDVVRLQCRRLLLSDTAYATEQSFRLTDDVKYTTDGAGYFKALTAEGNWKDLNYTDNSPSAWQPGWHLYRVMLLCREWNKNNNPQYLAAIHKALAFYIKNDFQCPNWWQNQINIPYAYSSIMLMLGGEANTAETTYLNDVIVSRELMQKAPTGQNKIWQKDIEARIALVHRDEAAFTTAVNAMQGVITMSTAEGIQPDNSFHQHGAMLQFGNYGLHFVNSLLFWMKLTANTPFAFEKEKQQIIFNYCSDGLRWTVFKGAMDITAIGRQVRPNFAGKRGVNLYDDFNLIKSFDNNPCNYFLDGFDPASTCTLAGNKSFWRSDYMVQLQAGQYMMSVKMHGPFVKKTESINGENLKGTYLSDGVSLVQRTGNEYKNIQAIWQWNMLPGTTTDTTINVSDAKLIASSNTSAFVGQVGDGTIGASAMYYNRMGISGYKSYFYVNDMLVALGAGISGPDKAHLVTTVNQRFYNSKTAKQVKGEGWIWHDNADKYAYMIKPASGLVVTHKMAAHLPVKIVSNTPNIQAVQSGNTLIAVFYKPGSLYLTETQRIQADQACIIICKGGAKGYEVWAADPTRKLSEMNLLINKKTVQVPFPQGDLLGKTVKAL